MMMQFIVVKDFRRRVGMVRLAQCCTTRGWSFESSDDFENPGMKQKATDVFFIHQRTVIYHDIVRIQDSAEFAFNNARGDGSHAILMLRTKRARFEVVPQQSSFEKGFDQAKGWLVLQFSGGPV
jgi:hypothetical protein